MIIVRFYDTENEQEVVFEPDVLRDLGHVEELVILSSGGRLIMSMALLLILLATFKVK